MSATDLQAALAAAGKLDLSSLPDNRAGRLTSRQAASLRRRHRWTRVALLFAGVPMTAVMSYAAFGAVTSARAGDALIDLLFVLLGLACVAGAAGIVGVGTDVSRGRVAVVEGVGAKYEGAGEIAYVRVGDRAFHAAERALYDEFREGVRYRAYFLPKSEQLVNLEVVGL